MADNASVNALDSHAVDAAAVLLRSDTLPKDPERVIRTYASDLAKLGGASSTVPAPAREPLRPAMPARETPIHEAPIVSHRAAAIAHSSAPPINRIPPPNLPGQDVSLQDAVGTIGIPKHFEDTPRIPPLQKRPEPLRQMSAPQPAQKAWEPEATVHENAPSILSRVSDFFFPPRRMTEAVPTYAPITPTQVVSPKSPEPLPIEAEAPALRPQPQYIDANPAAEEGDREAILARLRSRVDTYRSTNPEAAPIFPTPIPSANERPALRPLQMPGLPEPVSSEPERIRTFSSDFSRQIDTERASAFSVLAAQSDSRRSAPTPVPVTRTRYGLLYAVITVVLIVGGSTLLYFGYTHYSAQQPVAVAPSAPTSLIQGDDQAAITGEGAVLLNQLAQAGATDIPVGTVRVLYLNVSSTTATGETTVTRPGGALIEALDLPAPDILLRNISEDSTVGVVHAGNENRVFFVLGANSYERTFAGMLSWEATMGKDLASLYPAYVDALAAVATTTATTTPSKTASSTPPAVPKAPAFVDEVVESHDVRALKDSEGRTILIYGYRDQGTLIIARDETSFTVLLARLSANATQ